MKDPVFHCSNWNTELLSNFVILIAAVMHFERDQKFLAQIVNILPDLLEFQILMGSVERVLVLRALEKVLFRLITKHLLFLILPVVVDECIPHDGEQPSFQVGIFPEFVSIDQCLKHGILDEIARFFEEA